MMTQKMTTMMTRMRMRAMRMKGMRKRLEMMARMTYKWCAVGDGTRRIIALHEQRWTLGANKLYSTRVVFIQFVGGPEDYVEMALV